MPSAVVAAFLVTGVASATPVVVTAAPALGTEAPAGGEWTSYLVTVHGLGDGVSRGTVEITDGNGESSRAPFAVAAREAVHLELSFHDAFGKNLQVVTRDEASQLVDKTPLASARSRVPLLFDLGRTRRLEASLRNERVATRAGAGAWAAAGGLELAVSHASVDSESGEPRLPSRGLGYGGATVVTASSALLEGLSAPAFAALSDWVVGGGTLALTVAGPEDLDRPRLRALVGGAVVMTTPRDVSHFEDFEVVDDTTGSSAPPPTSYVTRHVVPSDAVTARLSSYRGSTLMDTRFGAMTSLGLGEVQVLGFDPTANDFVDDAWVRRSMVELVRQAWDRQSVVAFTRGEESVGGSRLDSLRRLLDPNEEHRWAIGLAAALLVAYALLALPLTFRRAAKRNAPLRAIVELPLWSFGTLIAIVVIGAIAKGGRARASRVSIVEAATDAPRAAVTRIRGFFASSAASLRVPALDPTSLLDVDSTSVTRALVETRGTAVLEDLQGRPWETLLVREDGFVNLDGRVNITRDSITNGLSHALVGVVACAPGDQFRYFARIDPGFAAKLDGGRPLGAPTAAAHRLDQYRFASAVDATAPGSSEVWSAFEAAAHEGTDFWPDDAPVVIAQVENGDPSTSDSGLGLDKARLFIRVVGNRGTP